VDGAAQIVDNLVPDAHESEARKMRGLVTSGLLALLAAAVGEARPMQAPPATGRERLAAADPLGAADAFRQSLRMGDLSRFTVQLAIFCDVANLERQVRTSGNPSELFVLRRMVGDRPCLGLYWGLFASRDVARAAVAGVPEALRAPGQVPVALHALLPPGAPAPSPVAAAPAPQTQVPIPAPQAVPPAEPEAMPAAPAEASVAPPPPLVEPPVSSEPAVAPPSVRVPAMEIAAGYAWLDDDAFPATGGSFEAGWILSGCANLNRSLGIVGEVNAEYETEDTLGGAPYRNLGLLGVHAGVRYALRRDSIATPYVQGLAGVTRSSVEVAGLRAVEDDFSIQPGAGLVFRLSDSVGLGLGADYRLVFGEKDERNELRLHGDLVFAIGSR
jgi:hypothetical protein